MYLHYITQCIFNKNVVYMYICFENLTKECILTDNNAKNI